LFCDISGRPSCSTRSRVRARQIRPRAILVVDEDEHPALAGLLDDVLGGGLDLAEGDPPSVLFERTHDF
jgi:hypothetical protein